MFLLTTGYPPCLILGRPSMISLLGRSIIRIAITFRSSNTKYQVLKISMTILQDLLLLRATSKPFSISLWCLLTSRLEY